MTPFLLFSVIAWACAVVAGGFGRGRRVAVFLGVMLGLYTLVAIALAAHTGMLFPVFVYLHVTVYVNFLVFLMHQRMRPLVYRLLVGWPASCFLAGTLLAFPWAIAAALGFPPLGFFVPYAVALLGFADTFFPRRSTVQITVGGPARAGFGRLERIQGQDARPLRIVQITDPHIGSFMSVERLRRVCERTVALQPDLVLLTGDFLTVESMSDHELLPKGLAPLKQLAGRCFACFGNHDHEAPEHVRKGLESAAIVLLVDAMTTVATAIGPVEILGFDFRRRDRKLHIEDVSARFPRSDALRIAMLHDPTGFRELPEGTADLVLSGHTHGGQLGLLWLGLPQTLISAIANIPDHGLWFRGKDLLYVHRGTGHYGFPIRLGVPPEESIIELHRAKAT